MNTVCLKILSMSIVLTVCSIDPGVAYCDMSNAMRAIALMSESESVNVQSGDCSLECTYVIDLSQESAEEIARIITLADKINKQSQSNNNKEQNPFGVYYHASECPIIKNISFNGLQYPLKEHTVNNQWFTSKLYSRAGPYQYVG